MQISVPVICDSDNSHTEGDEILLTGDCGNIDLMIDHRGDDRVITVDIGTLLIAVEAIKKLQETP